MSEQDNAIIRGLLAKRPLNKRLLNARLMCLLNGWDFIRIADGTDRIYPYQDREPSPHAAGGIVHAGTVIFRNPRPKEDHHHWQLWQGEIPDYCGSLTHALAAAKLLLPRASFVIYTGNEVFDFKAQASVTSPETKSGREFGSEILFTAEKESLALLSAVFSKLAELEEKMS